MILLDPNSKDTTLISGGQLDPLSLFVGFAISYMVKEFTEGYWDAKNVQY
jgi:hypothetical protein